MKTIKNALLVSVAVLSVAVASCGGDEKKETPPDEFVCVENPTTSEDILNACTSDDVVAIRKVPTLPLLNADGTLPPLP